jgi:hypothetical protein
VYDNKEGVGLIGGSKKGKSVQSPIPSFDDDSYSDPSSLQQGSKKTPFDMSQLFEKIRINSVSYFVN